MVNIKYHVNINFEIFRWSFDARNPTAHAVWKAFHDHIETQAGIIVDNQKWNPKTVAGKQFDVVLLWHFLDMNITFDLISTHAYKRTLSSMRIDLNYMTACFVVNPNHS